MQSGVYSRDQCVSVILNDNIWFIGLSGSLYQPSGARRNDPSLLHRARGSVTFRGRDDGTRRYISSGYDSRLWRRGLGRMHKPLEEVGQVGWRPIGGLGGHAWFRWARYGSVSIKCRKGFKRKHASAGFNASERR